MLNFKTGMSSLHCQCTDHMLASCDTPDSDWGTILFCIGVIFLFLRHIRDEESEDKFNLEADRSI